MAARGLFLVGAVGALALQSGPALSKSQSYTIEASAVESRAHADRGSFFVLPIELPNDVLGKRLDTVLLEFEVEVTLAGTEHRDMTPVVAAYPLGEELPATGTPAFSEAFSSARNIRAGSPQTVVVNITDIVRAWIADPSSNHGLVVGSFTGAKLNSLELKRDGVGAGKVARVTFFYQDRFGDHVAQE